MNDRQRARLQLATAAIIIAILVIVAVVTRGNAPPQKLGAIPPPPIVTALDKREAKACDEMQTLASGAWIEPNGEQLVESAASAIASRDNVSLTYVLKSPVWIPPPP